METVVIRRVRARMLAPTAHRSIIGAGLGTMLSVPGYERFLWRLDLRTITVEWDADSESDAQISAAFPDHERHVLVLSAGASVRWSLDAVPTVSKCRPGKSSKRVILRSEADRRAWFERKLSTAGRLTIDSLAPLPDEDWFFARAHGTLTISDPLALATLIVGGVGHGKNRGFGLLLCST